MYPIGAAAYAGQMTSLAAQVPLLDSGQFGPLRPAPEVSTSVIKERNDLPCVVEVDDAECLIQRQISK